MASNIISSNNRNWISSTYVAAGKLQEWVNKNPEKKTVDELTAGLEDTLNSMSDSEHAGVSKHLNGDAFDVQPVDTKDAKEIQDDMRNLPGATKFLDSEGGLQRWHVQF